MRKWIGTVALLVMACGPTDEVKGNNADANGEENSTSIERPGFISAVEPIGQIPEVYDTPGS